MGMEWFFEKYVLQRLNFTQKLDSFGETLFFYPVANTFSQTNCQIPNTPYMRCLAPDVALYHCSAPLAYARGALPVVEGNVRS